VAGHSQNKQAAKQADAQQDAAQQQQIADMQAQLDQQLAHAVDLVSQLGPAQAPGQPVGEVGPVAGIDHRLGLRLLV
jgi:hypothetical protein